jgi:glycosyltransferase involved in cell wall biosynthesis
LLEITDLSLLCSHEEGFSNAIIEAMIKKKPLIVTNVGGNAEAVQHETTGLVVPSRCPEALSKAILTLSTSPNKRKKYGEAGYKRAIENFELEQCVENYENTYLALLEDKGSDK